MRIIFIITLIFLYLNVQSQICQRNTPLSFTDSSKVLTHVETIEFDYISEHSPLNDSALAIGYGENVKIDFLKKATKFNYKNNQLTYILKIEVKGAYAIGLEFSNFYLPDSSKLYVFNEEKTKLLGAYSNYNNNTDSVFSIQLLPNDAIYIELDEPINNKETTIIEINRIAVFYHNYLSNKIVGACFEDVQCETGLEIDRSVMKWYFYDVKDGYYYVCSCSLINQDVIPNEIEPYLLTAKHCGKNAQLSTAIFYFNYQHPDCNATGGTDMFTMTGASEIARNNSFDMFLMKLNKFPPPDYNVYLEGWDRMSASDVDEVIGIHHPYGYRKSISLGERQANTNPNFLRIEWSLNNSPTAGGSSGSPLFDMNSNRCIGWLSYGTSDCSNLDGLDRYGKLKGAWSSTSPSNS